MTFETFDRIVVINLPERADRRREMAAMLSGVGLRLEQPPVRLLPAVRPHDAGGFPSIGARGCFMSHLAALTDAQSDGIERLLILEDDCELVTTAPGTFAALSRLDGWHLCYGGYSAAPFPARGEWTAVSPEVALGTTHCIGFSRAAIEAAVPYLTAMLHRPAGDPAGGPMHVDGAYNWLRTSRPDFVTLAATPQVAFQRSSRSDIHALAWYDRLPITRQLAHAMRLVKRRLR
jgi:hypothetical protein